MVILNSFYDKIYIIYKMLGGLQMNLIDESFEPKKIDNSKKMAKIILIMMVILVIAIIAISTIDSIFDVIKLKIMLYNNPKTIPHNNQFPISVCVILPLVTTSLSSTFSPPLIISKLHNITLEYHKHFFFTIVF